MRVACTIEYAEDPFSPPDTAEGVIDGLTESEVYILSRVSLEKGQKVIINTIVSLPTQKATVRSVKQDDDEYYKIGLDFSY